MAPGRPPLRSRTLLLPLALLVKAVFCSHLGFLTEPQDVIAKKNQTVWLDCLADGDGGTVNVTWHRRPLGRPIDVHQPGDVIVNDTRRYLLHTNGTLKILSFRPHRPRGGDEGTYWCLVKSPAGAIRSKDAHVQVAALPKFMVQPTSTQAVVGGVARFQCYTQNAVPPASISWEKDRLPLPPNDRFVQLPSGVLQIHKVQQNDTGRYRCVASNMLRERRSQPADLTVIYAPDADQEPRIVTKPQNLTVLAHQDVYMECMATGNPAPIMSWSRKNGNIGTSGVQILKGNLRLQDVTVDKSDTYVCSANKPQTRIRQTANAILTVVEPPKVIRGPVDMDDIATAKTARLPCDIRGTPKPKIEWLHNGIPVYVNGRIEQVDDNNELVITSVVLADEGIYQCIGFNDYGMVYRYARLTIKVESDSPDPPQNIQLITRSSTEILVRWSPSVSKSPIIAYTIHYLQTEGNNKEVKVPVNVSQTEFLVTNLLPNTNYTFYMSAYTREAASEMHSQQVVAKTMEGVPSAAPILSLSSRSPYSIDVGWQPLSREDSQGQIVNYKVKYNKEKDEDLEMAQEVRGWQTQLEIKGLNPDTTYRVCIAAATSRGYGPCSHYISQKTMKQNEREVLREPNLQVRALNSTAIDIHWEMPSLSPDEKILGFKLKYTGEDDIDHLPIALPSNLQHFLLGSLRPDTSYEVKLFAWNEKGDSPTATQLIKTMKTSTIVVPPVLSPMPPSNVIPVALNASSVRVTWSKPRMTTVEAEYYTVRYNPTDLQNATLVEYIRSNITSLIVNDLKPFTKYEFAVKSHSRQGTESKYTHASICQTKEGKPGPPAEVQVRLLSSGAAVLVEWLPPLESNGELKEFIILYVPFDSSLPDTDWSTVKTTADQTSATVNNLTFRTEYFFKMMASTEVGPGPASDPESVFTLPPVNPLVPGGKTTPGAGVTNNPRTGQGERNGMVTGIIVGVAIAVVCIMLCAIILLCRDPERRARLCCFGGDHAHHGNRGEHAPRRNGNIPNGHIRGQNDLYELDCYTPMLSALPPNPELDAKGPSEEVEKRLNGHVNGIVIMNGKLLANGKVISKRPDRPGGKPKHLNGHTKPASSGHPKTQVPKIDRKGDEDTWGGTRNGVNGIMMSIPIPKHSSFHEPSYLDLDLDDGPDQDYPLQMPDRACIDLDIPLHTGIGDDQGDSEQAPEAVDSGHPSSYSSSHGDEEDPLQADPLNGEDSSNSGQPTTSPHSTPEDVTVTTDAGSTDDVWQPRTPTDGRNDTDDVRVSPNSPSSSSNSLQSKVQSWSQGLHTSQGDGVPPSSPHNPGQTGQQGSLPAQRHRPSMWGDHGPPSPTPDRLEGHTSSTEPPHRQEKPNSDGQSVLVGDGQASGHNLPHELSQSPARRVPLSHGNSHDGTDCLHGIDYEV
ncbi:protogenin-like [Branchiostoma floridae]|uniref:Protogenin-like n=1 Tax=Branchiostoma floridae TaxID=7739 RepID=A0A9J7MK86_BRAFL|nr:protogenin-like [Branchiostoma floridae]